MKISDTDPPSVTNKNCLPVLGMSALVSGATDPVAFKAYDVYSQLDPELQAIIILSPEERADSIRYLLQNVHDRRRLGGILGIGAGMLSLTGGGVISLLASNALAFGLSATLGIGGFILCAFGLQVILGKKPSGKEAKDLASAVAQKRTVRKNNDKETAS